LSEYNRGLNLFDAPDLGKGLFIGRESEVQRMEKILQPPGNSQDRQILVLSGPGGIGKTQLAITYAKRHSSSYSSTFWLNASSKTALLTSLRRLAPQILPEAGDRLNDEAILVQVSVWLSQLDNNHWLLIFDNYDDPDQFNIREYYPLVAHGSIIVTTRQRDRVNGEEINLKPISKEEESLRILASRSGRKYVKSGKNLAKSSVST
jgi:NB-ARC domain